MTNTSNRGLGSSKMSQEEKQRIQSKGGQASPQNFANNPDLASEAGRKGGKASQGSGGSQGSGRGSNLTYEDRAEGGRNSHGSSSEEE